MKKIFSILLVAIMILSLVAGCQNEPAEETTEMAETTAATTVAETTAAPMEKTAVKFAVQADSTDALNQLIAAFNETSDLYTVESIVMTNDSGNMHDQLLNSL